MTLGPRLCQSLEAICLRLGALVVALLLFGLFVFAAGKNPISVYALMYKGAFGTWFSFQNSLQRAAPLILTALCTALPARLGLVVIGGEGALVIGALCASIAGLSVVHSGPMVVLVTMFLAGAISGGIWITIVGALRYLRGVNETISSLLMNYIAIAVLNHMVEGPFKDPESLNKPATLPIGDANMLGHMPGLDVHWGLAYGIFACLISYVLIQHTTFGFGVRTTGGNIRAGRIVGLPVGFLMLSTCFLAGAAAGLAGMVEVAAVHGTANASVIAGYGYTGILVAFIARQNPLAIMPVALLLGGVGASSGLLQRRLDLPDATVLVLQGIMFLVILTSESLYGRFKIFQPKAVPEKPQTPAVPPKASGDDGKLTEGLAVG
jgi:general nucleoside transport system permease protein